MNRTISWPDKSLAVEIFCAAGVLQDLELAAVDGLLAMPRIGLGVGGLLLGKRGNRRLDVLQALAIPCSHALGPAFVLTAEEVPAAGWRGGDNGLDSASETAAYDLVGCYWSKPNGRFALTDYDHLLFDALCPEPWHVGLLIRPSLGAVTTAAFGVRGEGNKLALGIPLELTEKRETDTEPGVPQELPGQAFADSEPGQKVVTVSPAETAMPPLPVASPPLPVAAPEAMAAPVIPISMPRTGTLFGVAQPPRKPRKSRRAPKVLLVIAIVLAVLAASAFFTRAWWLPQLKIALQSYLPASGISK